MLHELHLRALSAQNQVAVPVVWEGVTIDVGFRADIIVDKKLVIELKSVEEVVPVHKKQLRTYLRLTDTRLGLLINFNVALIKDGISRVVNNLQD
jgi:GxxExxY protein